MGNENTRFKKGVSGNPSGRPKKNPKIEAFQKSTYSDFIDALQLYGNMTIGELAVEKDRNDLRAFDALCANVVFDAAVGNKDVRKDARQILLDRIWGKPKESELTPFEAEHDMMRRIPMHELVELARKYQGHADLRTDSNLSEAS